MKVVTLKLENQRDLNFLKNILERLNISYEMVDVKPNVTIPQNDIVAELFGSWKSDESSHELIKTIRSKDARV